MYINILFNVFININYFNNESKKNELYIMFLECKNGYVHFDDYIIILNLVIDIFKVLKVKVSVI